MEKTASRFWDRIADKYARDPIADEAAYQTKLKVTQSYFTPETRVLEFGCGTGSTAIIHAPHVAHIDAIDFSRRMLEIARDRADKAGVSNLTFAQGDIMEIDVKAGYDVVMAMSVLHLLKDPQAAISKIYDVLTPGGHFISSTACLADWMKFIKYVAPAGRAVGLLPQLKVFGADEFVGNLRRAGFDIVHRWQPDRKAALFVVAQKPA